MSRLILSLVRVHFPETGLATGSMRCWALSENYCVHSHFRHPTAPRGGEVATLKALSDGAWTCRFETLGAERPSGAITMNNSRAMRLMKKLRWPASGAVLLQLGGCTLSEINELVQTIFLGITAAGGIAILENV